MRPVTVLAVALTLGVARGGDGVPARVVFEVCDDVGRALPGAAIQGWFGDVSDVGAHDLFEGAADASGEYVVTGRLTTDVNAIIRMGGHYVSRVQQRRPAADQGFAKGWSTAVPVRLKRIRSPIPLRAKRIENASFSPVENGGGYCRARVQTLDLLTGHFLLTGEAGAKGCLEFTWTMTVHRTNELGRALEYEMRSEIRTLQDGDGLRRGEPAGDLTGRTGSALVSDYEAPVGGYTNSIVIYRRVQGGKVETNDDQHYLHYFRIRSQLNEQGEVTNALYGKIYGPLNGNFRYYLNPTPNDRNVEFDPERNLFEGLDSLERVTMP